MDRSRVSFYLRLTFGIFLLFILARIIDFHRFQATLVSANLQWVAFSLAAMMANFLLKTYRWAYILRHRRPDLSLARLTRLNFLSLFLGNFLPTSLSYDIVRVYYLSQRAADPRVAISSIFADRVVGHFSVALAALSAFLVLTAAGLVEIGWVLSYGIILFLLASLGLPLALRSAAAIRALRWVLNRFTGKKLFDSVQDFSEHLLDFWRQVPVMSMALALAFANLGLAVGEFYLIAEAFSAQVPIGYFVLFIPLIIFLSMLPVSVGGIGLVEGGLVFFFSHVGVPPETCLSIALVHRTLQLVCVLPGGLIYLSEGVPRFAA